MTRIEGTIGKWWNRLQAERRVAARLREPLPALRSEPSLEDVAARRAAHWQSDRAFAANLAKIDEFRQRTSFSEFEVASLARAELRRVVRDFAMGNAREPRS